METENYNREDYNQNHSPEKIPNKRRLVEILIGVVFVILLVLIVFLVISYSGNGSKIVNSFNTYTIYNNVPAQTDYSSKPYIIDMRDYYRRDYAQVYYIPNDLRYAEPYKKPLAYYDDAQLKTVTGALGNDIDRYEVYVKNREYVGGYFKVVFYFEDYYGKTSSQSITEYIPAREEKLFLLKDISPDRYKYRNWWYEVESLSKVPSRVYYN